MYFLWYLLCSLPLLSFCSSYPSLQLSFFRVLYGMVSSVSLRLLLFLITLFVFVFFFNQTTAYDVRIIDWSSDVCSSDLVCGLQGGVGHRLAPMPVGPGDEPRDDSSVWCDSRAVNPITLSARSRRAAATSQPRARLESCDFTSPSRRAASLP